MWLTRVVGDAQYTPFCAASGPHPAAAGLAQIRRVFVRHWDER